MLEQILQKAREIEDVFQRSEALTYLVQACLQAGQFDQALMLAETIENTYKKVVTLTAIAQAFSKAGIQDKASEILEQALQAIQPGFSDRNTGMSDILIHELSLCLIASNYVIIGQYTQAIQVAQNHPYHTQDESHNEIAQNERQPQTSQINMMQTDIPLKAAARFEQVFPSSSRPIRDWYSDPSKRAEILEVARAGARAGDFQKFVQAMRVTDDEISGDHQAKALTTVAGECAKAGQFSFALQAMQMAEATGFLKIGQNLPVLSALAIKYAEVGQYDLAIQTLQKIDNLDWRADVSWKIARKLTEARQYEQALKLIETIKRADERNFALEDLAKKYAEAGQYDQALQTAKLIKKICLRHSAVKKVVEKYVESGQYDQALQIAKRARKNDFKAEFLLTVANGLTNAEMSSQVAALLSKLLHLSPSVENTIAYRNLLLIKIAEQYLRVKQSDKAAEVLSQALEETSAIEVTAAKAYALTDIAIKYAELGQTPTARTVLSQALQIVENNEPIPGTTISYKADALSGIASKLAEAGQCEQALQIIEKIEISDDFSLSKHDSARNKCIALTNVAEKYVELNQKDKAAEVLSKILQVPDLKDSSKASNVGTVARIYFNMENPSMVLST